MRRRALAWGLLLYGAAGIGLAITGAVVGLDVAGRMERLATDADATLEAAAAATAAAADSFENVDASLSGAEASVASGATLARNASGTLGRLAAAMDVTILGTQPLRELAGDFAESAEQAAQLADTLTDVEASLGDTRSDVAGIGTELADLADRLEALRATDDAAGAPPVRLFVALLLTWLLLPAIGSLVAGFALLRRAPIAASSAG